MSEPISPTSPLAGFTVRRVRQFDEMRSLYEAECPLGCGVKQTSLVMFETDAKKTLWDLTYKHIQQAHPDRV